MKNSIIIFSILLLLGCKQENLPSSYFILNVENQSHIFTPDPVLSINYDQRGQSLSVPMEDVKNNYRLVFGINALDLLNLNFPYFVNNDLDSATGVIDLTNGNIDVPHRFGPDDDVNLEGVTFAQPAIKIELTSFENGVLIGKVSGVMQTRTGRQETIEKAEFKLEVEVVN